MPQGNRQKPGLYMRKPRMGLLVAALAAMFSTSAFADEWVATKLRGAVLVLVDNDWVKLKRGEVVSDDRVIRTLSTGRVSFERGNETIELGGDTQVQIIDRTGKKFTTVKQYFGSIAVEADVRQVQHFAVQTPYLAAVVKGTRFTVVSGKDSAKVSVQRGHVAVEDRDTHESTLLSVGQSASTGSGVPLDIAGRGELPVVYGANGKPVFDESPSPKAIREAALAAGATPQEAARAAKEARQESKSEDRGSDNSGNGNSGSSGNSGSGNSGNGKGKKDKD